MRKWWRKFKNRHGWDFSKKNLGPTALKTREDGKVVSIADKNGCYVYRCKYCTFDLIFPWSMTNLFYHNMQRHIQAKHIDVL